MVLKSIFKNKTVVVISDDSTSSVAFPIIAQVILLILSVWALTYFGYAALERSSLIGELIRNKNKASAFEAKNRTLIDALEEMDRIVGVSLNYLEQTDKVSKAQDLRKLIQDVEEKSQSQNEVPEEENVTVSGHIKRIAEDIKRRIESTEGVLALFSIRPSETKSVGSGVDDSEGGGVGGEFIPVPVAHKGINNSNKQPVSKTTGGVAVAKETLEHQIHRLVRLKNRTKNLPLGAPMPYTRISSKFGRRVDPFLKKMAVHNGIDLVAPQNTIIKATGGGQIVHAGYMGSYGNTVVIDHGNKIKAIYAHLKSVKVKKGQHIRKGEALGYIGNTGRSSGTHLHYQIEINGKAVNPERFLYIGAH